jgi:hypothetical protein
MRLQQIALVTESSRLPRAAMDSVAAALQVQVLRDLGPAWGITATVDAFDSVDAVPPTYYPMVVMDDLPVSAAGIHLDQDFTPFALVEFSNRWTLTASHEALEMLVDPFGNRFQTADSIKNDQGIVEYLVEVCDPSEAVANSYRINGVVVSDFYLPSFFEPVGVDGGRYSFTGAVKRPLQVVQGGYLSWRNPVTNDWWQQTWFDANGPAFRNLGPLSGQESPRRWLDRQIFEIHDQAVTGVPQHSEEHELLVAAYALAVRGSDSASGHARRLRHEIEALTK